MAQSVKYTYRVYTVDDDDGSEHDVYITSVVDPKEKPPPVSTYCKHPPYTTAPAVSAFMDAHHQMGRVVRLEVTCAPVLSALEEDAERARAALRELLPDHKPYDTLEEGVRSALERLTEAVHVKDVDARRLAAALDKERQAARLRNLPEWVISELADAELARQAIYSWLPDHEGGETLLEDVNEALRSLSRGEDEKQERIEELERELDELRGAHEDLQARVDDETTDADIAHESEMESLRLQLAAAQEALHALQGHRQEVGLWTTLSQLFGAEGPYKAEYTSAELIERVAEGDVFLGDKATAAQMEGATGEGTDTLVEVAMVPVRACTVAPRKPRSVKATLRTDKVQPAFQRGRPGEFKLWTTVAQDQQNAVPECFLNSPQDDIYTWADRESADDNADAGSNVVVELDVRIVRAKVVGKP